MSILLENVFVTPLPDWYLFRRDGRAIVPAKTQVAQLVYRTGQSPATVYYIPKKVATVRPWVVLPTDVFVHDGTIQSMPSGFVNERTPSEFDWHIGHSLLVRLPAPVEMKMQGNTLVGFITNFRDLRPEQK
jgi:hypothetical protein